MPNNNKIKRVIDALAIGTTVMVSEHFFSTFLSSPLTVETLYNNDRDKGKVKTYLFQAIVISIVFGIIISYILDDPLGVISAIVVSLLYGVIYYRAMGLI